MASTTAMTKVALGSFLQQKVPFVNKQVTLHPYSYLYTSYNITTIL